MFNPAPTWRKSVWTKLIAGCFIFQIIIGNIWLIQRFSVSEPPNWLQTCFITSIGALFVCGAALGAERLFMKIVRIDDEQHDSEV